MGRIDELVSMVREGRIGFLFDEVMSGTHEFLPGFGPPGRRLMEFRATWGSKQLQQFLDPRDRGFLEAALQGQVTVDGLCRQTPCEGSLKLDYFGNHILRYTFEFQVEQKRYRYVGEKVNVMPWNLLVSHTTCFGTIVEVDTNALVSRSVTHFRLWRAPAFVASFRLA